MLYYMNCIRTGEKILISNVSVLRITDSYYPFGIFKLFLLFHLQFECYTY